jgi:hypothetical protein
MEIERIWSGSARLGRNLEMFPMWNYMDVYEFKLLRKLYYEQ